MEELRLRIDDTEDADVIADWCYYAHAYRKTRLSEREKQIARAVFAASSYPTPDWLKSDD